MVLPGDTDFQSVDVEGLDLDVLRSSDWAKYRPRMIVAEVLEADLIGMKSDAIVEYLMEQGYKPVVKTGCSVIFASQQRE